MRAGWAAMLLLLAAPGHAAGQQRMASLEVWLRAGPGETRAGVVIAAEREDGLEHHACATREDGRCVMLAVAPGRYRVGAPLPNGDGVAIVVDLGPGGHVKVTLGSRPASLRDARGATEAAETAGRGLGREALASLPAGRPLLDALRVGAGPPSTGDWRLDWAPASQMRVFVEGVEWNRPSPDLLGALRFESDASSPAASARGTAGAIQAVLRSGGARRDAEISLSYAGSGLAGAPRPFSRYSPWDSDRVERDVTVPATPWTAVSPAVSLGGPLGPPGLSFHAAGAYSGRTRHREVVFIDDPGRLTRRFSWFSWSGRASANVTAAAKGGRRARLALTAGRGRNRGGAPALEPDGGTMPDGTPTAGLTRAPFLGPVETVARWRDTGADSRRLLVLPSFDWPLGSAASFSADASIALGDSWTPPDFRGHEIRHVFANSNARVPGLSPEDVHPGGFADQPSSYGTVKDSTRRSQLALEARWSPGRRSAHQFSGGVRIDRLADSVYIGHARPIIRLHWNQAHSTAGGQPSRGRYGYYTVSRPGTIGQAAGTTVAAWLQDRWSPTREITFEAGVRAEREAPPSYGRDPDVRRTIFGFGETLAPRLSLLWSPGAAGGWRLEGSYGLYHDHLTTRLARALFGGRRDVRESWTLDTLDWRSLACDVGRPDCPGRFIDREDLRPPWNALDAEITSLLGSPATRVDPALRPMRSAEWGAGIERRLRGGLSLAARYTGKRLLEAVEDIGLSLPGGGETSVLANPGDGYGALTAPGRPPWFRLPRATRRYDALDLEVRRRGRPVSFAFRYRHSRLTGNYGGLAAADEGGRESTNMTSAFDSPFSSFDRHGRFVDGPLPGDRPHRLWLDAVVVLPSATTLALAGVVESGRPESSHVSFRGIPVFFNGYGDLGRQPASSQLDLQLRQDFRLGRGLLTLEAAVENLFDQAATLGYFSTSPYRDDLSLPEGAFFVNPWEPADWVRGLRAAGVPVRDEQLYLVADRFQRPRRATLTATVRF